jgi:hypothetical protein
MSCKYLELDIVGVLLPKASEKGEVTSEPHVLEEAALLGKHLK